MRRKQLIVISVLFVLALCYLCLPYLNGRNRYVNYINYILRGNNLTVSCSSSLDIKNITVVFENETALIQNRDPERAARMLHKKNPAVLMRDTVFFQGKQLMAIPYDYGKQRLAVYYDQVYIGELHHWQTNYYHAHDYTVHVKSAKGILVLNGKTSGPDITNPVLRVE